MSVRTARAKTNANVRQMVNSNKDKDDGWILTIEAQYVSEDDIVELEIVPHALPRNFK